MTDGDESKDERTEYDLFLFVVQCSVPTSWSTMYQDSCARADGIPDEVTILDNFLTVHCIKQTAKESSITDFFDAHSGI